jgi:hypothetical protein
MPSVLTVRLSSEELGSCDAKATSMGLTRTDYVKHLIHRDLKEKSGGTAKRRFASTDLIGKFSIGTGSTNTAVRSALARRAREKSR